MKTHRNPRFFGRQTVILIAVPLLLLIIDQTGRGILFEIRKNVFGLVENPLSEKKKYHPSKRHLAFPGLTLFASKAQRTTFLINLEGEVVRRWPLKSERVKLLPNCNLMFIRKNSGENNTLEVIDWEGTPLLQYELNGSAHHDFFPKNNSVLVITEDKRKHNDVEYHHDEIIEISHNQRVLFRWSYPQHVQPFSCKPGSCLYRNYYSPDALDWTHTNSVSEIPRNPHFNAGDQRFKPGNLILVPRNWSVVLIVERDSGKVVWSYEGDYKGGLEGVHDAHMIPPGNPGWGNILLLDNGDHRSRLY